LGTVRALLSDADQPAREPRGAEPMSAIDKAVEIAASVAIDWEEMGRAFSEQFANDQGYFLLGMWEESVDSQAEAIGNASVFGGRSNSTRSEVAEYLRRVADAIENGPK